MAISRRSFVAATGTAFAAGAASAALAEGMAWDGATGEVQQPDPAPAAPAATPPDPAPDASPTGWDAVRAAFPLDPDWVEMSAMLVTAHPAPVAEAIARHRAALDRNPVVYLEESNRPLQDRSRDAAARYLGGLTGRDVALTDSTTQGVALVYQGLRLKPGQEVLTTDQDYYVTHESLRLATARQQASLRRVPLYDVRRAAGVSADELASRILDQVRPETRALALTWVHSSTGVKLPLADIAAGLRELNKGRDDDDAVLLCVDGVHGVGNQTDSFRALGCDFLVAGCHKWLFGPRGTGFVAGTDRGWRAVEPTIPSFLDSGAYGRWIRGEPAGPGETTAAAFSPGGFKPFEHLFALAEAFAFQEAMGKDRVAARTAELAGQLKEGLAGIDGVILRTPLSPNLSAGIVSFDVDGRHPRAVVNHLRDRRVIASVAPYPVPHVRLTPSVRNTPAEVEAALAALRDLAVG